MVPPTDPKGRLLPILPISSQSDQQLSLPGFRALIEAAGVVDSSPRPLGIRQRSDLPSPTTAEEALSATNDQDPDHWRSPIFTPPNLPLDLRRLSFRTYKIDNMPYTCPVPANEDVSHVQRRTVDGRLLTYRLTVLQQPERARACGAGARCKSYSALPTSNYFFSIADAT